MLKLSIAIWLAGGLPESPADLAKSTARAAAEQSIIDDALAAWENKANSCKTFRCNFTKWKYDLVFQPPRRGEDPTPVRISSGEIEYAAPDKGLIIEKTAKGLKPNLKTQQMEWAKLDSLDQWACDGKMIYKVDHEQKTVERFAIPKQQHDERSERRSWFTFFYPFLDRSRILGFIVPPFGIKVTAAEIKANYSIRAEKWPERNRETWLEFRPRHPKDAAYFAKIEVLLDRNGAPTATQITFNLNEYEVFAFDHQEYDPVEPFAADTFASHPNGYKLISP